MGKSFLFLSTAVRKEAPLEGPLNDSEEYPETFTTICSGSEAGSYLRLIDF